MSATTSQAHGQDPTRAHGPLRVEGEGAQVVDDAHRLVHRARQLRGRHRRRRVREPRRARHVRRRRVDVLGALHRVLDDLLERRGLGGARAAQALHGLKGLVEPDADDGDHDHDGGDEDDGEPERDPLPESEGVVAAALVLARPRKLRILALRLLGNAALLE